MSGPAKFPLDAEQVVRLTAAVVWEIRETFRHPHTRPVKHTEILRRLAGSVGVKIPADEETRGTVVLPNGLRVREQPASPETSPGNPGGSDEE